MKKFVLVLFAFLLLAGTAYAEGVTVDFGPAHATEPTGDLGTTIGGVVGVSLDFSKIIAKEFNQRDRLRFRGDIGYFKWEDDESVSTFGGEIETDIEFKRIPVFLGARYVYPVNPVVSVFGEGGLEISFDSVEVEVCTTAFGVKNCESDDDSETNTGIAIGGGAIFNITEKFRIALSGRSHQIEDDYQTFMAAFGFNF